MKTTPGNAIIILPEPGHERELAMRLYAAKTELYVAILDAVVGRPGVRYKDLLPLVGTKSRNLLTKSLLRLQMEGILFRRGFGEDQAGYQLTPLGLMVRDAIVEYRLLDRLNQAVGSSTSRTRSDRR